MKSMSISMGFFGHFSLFFVCFFFVFVFAFSFFWIPCIIQNFFEFVQTLNPFNRLILVPRGVSITMTFILTPNILLQLLQEVDRNCVWKASFFICIFVVIIRETIAMHTPVRFPLYKSCTPFHPYHKFH